MSEFTDRAVGTLSQADATASDLKDLMAELRQQWATATTRHGQIAKNGPERKRIVQSGDSKKLKALEEEATELGAEIEILDGLRQRLTDAIREAKAREAVDSLPTAYETLETLLNDEAEICRKLAAARQKTEEHLKVINQARVDIVQLNLKGPGQLAVPEADPALLGWFAKARGYQRQQGGGWGRAGPVLGLVARQLGIQLPGAHRAA